MTDKDVEKVKKETNKEELATCPNCGSAKLVDTVLPDSPLDYKCGKCGEVFTDAPLNKFVKIKDFDEALIRMKQLCVKNMIKNHNNEQVRLGQIILRKDEKISSLKAELEKCNAAYLSEKKIHEQLEKSINEIFMPEIKNLKEQKEFMGCPCDMGSNPNPPFHLHKSKREEELQTENERLKNELNNYERHLKPGSPMYECCIANVEKAKAEGRRETLKEVEISLMDESERCNSNWDIIDIDDIKNVIQKLKQKKETG